MAGPTASGRARMPTRGQRAERIEDLVALQVAERSPAVAVCEPSGRSLTYGQLWDQSGRLAGRLAQLAIGRGNVVGIALDRGIDMVVAALGVARSGAAYVLLDPQSPPARNASILEEVEAAALVDSAVSAPWAPPTTVPRLVLPLAGSTEPEPAPSVSVSAEDEPLYLAFTSGSTGRPKGVIASHRAVIHFSTETVLCALSPDDRVASLSSPASDATTFELWKPLVAGATIVVLPAVAELDVEDWRVVLGESGVTAMFIMAGLLGLILQYDPHAFGQLRTLVFGGEALHPQSLRRIFAGTPPQRLMLGYGPTETTVFATTFECTEQSIAECDRIPLGSALPGYTLFVLDEQQRPVRPGDTGELYIGGPAVANGYLARAQLTAERFVHLADGVGEALVYRTGDLVRQLADGNLEFAARVDRQVKIRGYRVELEEVERGILGTGMVEAAIVEKVDDMGPPHLVCFYRTAEPVDGANAGATAIALSAAVATRLPGYMIPARWIGVSEFPLTTTGKVDRRQLVDGLVGARPPAQSRLSKEAR
jgi:amino acid adenylation domain-containing protein